MGRDVQPFFTENMMNLSNRRLWWTFFIGEGSVMLASLPVMAAENSTNTEAQLYWFSIAVLILLFGCAAMFVMLTYAYRELSRVWPIARWTWLAETKEERRERWICWRRFNALAEARRLATYRKSPKYIEREAVATEEWEFHYSRLVKNQGMCAPE